MTCGNRRIYQNDIGTEFLVDVCTTITGATVKNLIVRKPDGTMATWTGVIEGTTQIKYVVVLGDLDQVGEYMLHAYVEVSGGKWTGNLASFRVYARFVA
ncbi:MAG: hypothetical protein PHR35_14690 [Kiritimatiellae bacterium]|nr:hypothetical protein [Kiritimatiellia bacterium]